MRCSTRQARLIFEGVLTVSEIATLLFSRKRDRGTNAKFKNLSPNCLHTFYPRFVCQRGVSELLDFNLRESIDCCNVRSMIKHANFSYSRNTDMPPAKLHFIFNTLLIMRRTTIRAFNGDIFRVPNNFENS